VAGSTGRHSLRLEVQRQLVEHVVDRDEQV
jgi:hypothetical protein